MIWYKVVQLQLQPECWCGTHIAGVYRQGAADRFIHSGAVSKGKSLPHTYYATY